MDAATGRKGAKAARMDRVGGILAGLVNQPVKEGSEQEMTPNPMKDTLGSNHCQTLEAMVKNVVSDVAKAKAGDTEEGKELLADAEQLQKQINNLKLVIAKLPVSDPKYTKCKDAVVEFQKK